MQFVGLQFLPKGAQLFLQNSVHLTNGIHNYFGLLIASFDSSMFDFLVQCRLTDLVQDIVVHHIRLILMT